MNHKRSKAIVALVTLLAVFFASSTLAGAEEEWIRAANRFTLGWFFDQPGEAQGPALFAAIDTLAYMGLTCRTPIDSKMNLEMFYMLTQARREIPGWQTASLIGAMLLWLVRDHGCRFDTKRLAVMHNVPALMRELR